MQHISLAGFIEYNQHQQEEIYPNAAIRNKNIDSVHSKLATVCVQSM